MPAAKRRGIDTLKSLTAKNYMSECTPQAHVGMHRCFATICKKEQYENKPNTWINALRGQAHVIRTVIRDVLVLRCENFVLHSQASSYVSSGVCVSIKNSKPGEYLIP